MGPQPGFWRCALMTVLCGHGRDLKTLLQQQSNILKGLETMSAALERLTASVAKLTETVAAIPAPADDSPALSALADQVDAAIVQLAPPIVEAPVVEPAADSAA